MGHPQDSIQAEKVEAYRIELIKRMDEFIPTLQALSRLNRLPTEELGRFIGSD